MRVHGTARVSTEPADIAEFHGAFALIVLTIGRIFPNCGRYIHQGEVSRFVPREGHEPPVPAWKTYEFLNDALPADDPARTAEP